MRMTIEEYKAYQEKHNSGGKSKYGNTRTEYNGILYDSAKEAGRALQLDMLQRAGKVSNVKRQVSIPLMVNGVKVATYRADFIYTDNETGVQVIEDVKGYETAIFKLKKKILEANGYKITIT